MGKFALDTVFRVWTRVSLGFLLITTRQQKICFTFGENCALCCLPLIANTVYRILLNEVTHSLKLWVATDAARCMVAV